MTLSTRLSALLLGVAATTLVACGDKGEDDSGDEVGGGGAGADGSDGADGTSDGTSDGGAGDGSDGGEGYGPGAQFIYDYGMRGCELYRQCSPPESLEVYPYESCVQQVELAANNYPEGVCTYNEANGEACMAWINSVDCDGYNGDAPEACSNAYTCPD